MSEQAKTPFLTRRLLLGGGALAAGMAAMAAPAAAASRPPNYRAVLEDLSRARRNLASGNDGHPTHRRRAIQLIDQAIRETELALRRGPQWQDPRWRRNNGYDNWSWRFSS